MDEKNPGVGADMNSGADVGPDAGRCAGEGINARVGVGVGVGVIIVSGGRVLMGKRRGAHGAGSWSFPGGHLEFGESIEACAERETIEETGLRVGNIRRAPYTSDLFKAEGKHYVTLFVVADHVTGKPRNREPERCEGWEWFGWDRLPEPLFPPVRSLLEAGFRPEGC